MICEPCTEAGVLVTRKAANPRFRMGHINRDIKELHDECPGGTWCDCQHGIESALNAELPKAANVGVGAAEE